MGSPSSYAATARCGSSISTIGPSHTARTAETLPTARKGGTSSSRLRSQLLAMTSGPMPAGSPSETASGTVGWSAIVDHRVAPEIAQITLRAALHPLLGHL